MTLSSNNPDSLSLVAFGLSPPGPKSRRGKCCEGGGEEACLDVKGAGGKGELVLC